MKDRLFIPLVLLAHTCGCAQTPEPAAEDKSTQAVSDTFHLGHPVIGKSFTTEAFTTGLDRLLLSDLPLHYMKSHSALAELDEFQRRGELSSEHRQIVAARLRKFLARTEPRPIDLQGGLSGVAPPEGVLRVYAVKLLGKLGAAKDVSFLAKLQESYVAAHPKLFAYPHFADECQVAAKAIEARLR